jgi:hypothetical protein
MHVVSALAAAFFGIPTIITILLLIPALIGGGIAQGLGLDTKPVFEVFAWLLCAVLLLSVPIILGVALGAVPGPRVKGWDSTACRYFGDDD